jgi:transposase
MMIDSRGRPGKAAADPFRPPPWTRTAPEWRQLDEQLEPDHLARLIDRGVDQLDLTPLLQSYAGRGSPACRPDLMLKIVLFEIQRGRTRPAQWYLDTKENIALHWLGQGLRPARSVWYAFAGRLQPFLDGWNQQVLHQAQEQGCTAATRAALDGTLVEAQASRHHLLNHEQLQQRRQVLDAALQADAQGTTPAEQPYWMAHTAATRCRQSDQYQLAQTKLNERWAENQQRIPSKRQEAKNVRISVTDPEAALGKDKHKVYRPLYNVQYVRDLDSPFLLGYDTFAHSSDTGTLVPMMQRTQQLTGHRPETVLVDSGYITALDLADARELGLALFGPWKENDYSDSAAAAAKQWSKDEFRWDAQAREYRCPQQQPLQLTGVQNRPRSRERTEKLELYQADAATCAACPLKARCCPKSRSGRHLNRSEHEELIEAHRRKMATPEAKELYKLRRQTVETSFGDAKQHRSFRRVNGRGLEKAKAHTALTVLAHNLQELVNAGTQERKT